MSAHTPGPWDLDGCTDEGRVSCGGAPHYYQIDASIPKGLSPSWPYTVADTLNRHHCISPEEDLANARLIAASPDLLVALKRARQGYANMLEFRVLRDEDKRAATRDILEQCDKAIAKAEGK